MKIPKTTIEDAIQTINFTLEPITTKHAQPLYKSLQDSALYTYIPFEPPQSIEALAERYQRWSIRQADDGSEIWLNYAIYWPQDKEYVGTLQATIEKAGKTYIAYEVFPPYWRRGIACEAVSALLTYLFEACTVQAILAHTDTRNEASSKLLSALGFCYKETIEGADYFKGSSSDEYVYELRKDDWIKADNRESRDFYKKYGLVKTGNSINDFNGRQVVEYRTK